MLNIENNDPFSAFSLVLSYSHKPTKPRYTFNCYFIQDIITKEKKFRPPNPLILLAWTENFQAYTYPYFAKHWK